MSKLMDDFSRLPPGLNPAWVQVRLRTKRDLVLANGMSVAAGTDLRGAPYRHGRTPQWLVGSPDWRSAPALLEPEDVRELNLVVFVQFYRIDPVDEADERPRAVVVFGQDQLDPVELVVSGSDYEFPGASERTLPNELVPGFELIAHYLSEGAGWGSFDISPLHGTITHISLPLLGEGPPFVLLEDPPSLEAASGWMAEALEASERSATMREVEVKGETVVVAAATEEEWPVVACAALLRAADEKADGAAGEYMVQWQGKPFTIRVSQAGRPGQLLRPDGLDESFFEVVRFWVNAKGVGVATMGYDRPGVRPETFSHVAATLLVDAEQFYNGRGVDVRHLRELLRAELESRWLEGAKH